MNHFILITVITECPYLLSELLELDTILNTPSISNLWDPTLILYHSTHYHSGYTLPDRTRLDLLHSALDQTVAISQAQQKQQHHQHAHPRDLFVWQRVLVCNFSPRPTWLRGTIIKYNGPLSYRVKVSDDKSGIDTLIHPLESVDTSQNPSNVSEIPSEVSSQPDSSETVQCDKVNSRGSESKPAELTSQHETTPLSTSSMASLSPVTVHHLHDDTFSETDVHLTGVHWSI